MHPIVSVIDTNAIRKIEIDNDVIEIISSIPSYFCMV